ncbi:VWA domain-containing protein [Paenibacillus sp. P26]|nr:VWA domain-containing protein [Paenibacillus sp. P26]
MDPDACVLDRRCGQTGHHGEAGPGPEPSGQTDIGKALGQAVQRLTAAGTPKNRGAVILISDGFSETNVDEVTAPYISQGYRIYTVGLEMASNQDGKRSLERLAYATGEPTGRCSMRAS